jgi:hypothetical protein
VLGTTLTDTRQNSELSADHERLELHGAALSSARRNPERQVDIPGSAACELIKYAFVPKSGPEAPEITDLAPGSVGVDLEREHCHIGVGRRKLFQACEVPGALRLKPQRFSGRIS